MPLRPAAFILLVSTCTVEEDELAAEEVASHPIADPKSELAAEEVESLPIANPKSELAAEEFESHPIANPKSEPIDMAVDLTKEKEVEPRANGGMFATCSKDMFKAA